MIELALAIIATSYESFDLAGLGIEADQGDLRRFERSTLFAALCDQSVDFPHTLGDGFDGIALQERIEGGVDFRSGTLEITVAKLFG